MGIKSYKYMVLQGLDILVFQELTTIPTRNSKPLKPRKVKVISHTEEHEVFGGRIKVFRTRQPNDVWQKRLWFRANHKYLKRSLLTKHLPEALEESENSHLEIRSKVNIGSRIEVS